MNELDQKDKYPSEKLQFSKVNLMDIMNAMFAGGGLIAFFGVGVFVHFVADSFRIDKLSSVIILFMLYPLCLILYAVKFKFKSSPNNGEQVVVVKGIPLWLTLILVIMLLFSCGKDFDYQYQQWLHFLTFTYLLITSFLLKHRLSGNNINEYWVRVFAFLCILYNPFLILPVSETFWYKIHITTAISCVLISPLTYQCYKYIETKNSG